MMLPPWVSQSGVARVLCFGFLLVSIVALVMAQRGYDFGSAGSVLTGRSKTAHDSGGGAVQTGSLDDVFGASYESVENSTEPVVLYEYIPSPLTPTPVAEAFIGAEELHMSHLVCAGQFRWNKTCVFRNLYMDARPTSGSHSWLFFASYPPDSSDAERRALLAQLNLDARVELNPFLRWEGETSKMAVTAVLFERRREVARVPRFSGEAGARGYEPADGSWDPEALPSQDAWAALPWPRPPRPYVPRGPRDAPMVPPALVQTAVGDRWVAHSSTGVDEGVEELDGYTYACKLTRAAAAARAAGMACLPPGVSAVIQRPQLILDDTLGNPGHFIWDNIIPLLSCLLDLGLLGRESHFQMHFSVAPSNHWRTEKGIFPVTRGMLRAVSPEYWPVTGALVWKQSLGHLVLHRTVMAGMSGRGTSALLPNYSSYYADSKNLVWYLRQTYLANLNLTAEDNDWSKTVAGKPVAPRSLRVVILQKIGKREIKNLRFLLPQLHDAFPEAEFTTLSWEDLKSGAAGEARVLLNAHVCVSSDGTGANNLFLLPRGAVHISLGVVRPWGTGHLADMIFTGVRHIRVLYYDGLSVYEDVQRVRLPEHENRLYVGAEANFNVSFERFQPFMRRALDLVAGGFPTPVPFLVNHSPVGRAVVRVFSAFPELARRGSYSYMATLSGDGLIMDPPGLFNTSGGRWWAHGTPMPAGLQDVIDGKAGGEPAGPDVNEVSGHSLQEAIADGPKWKELVMTDFFFGSFRRDPYAWHHY